MLIPHDTSFLMEYTVMMRTPIKGNQGCLWYDTLWDQTHDIPNSKPPFYQQAIEAVGDTYTFFFFTNHDPPRLPAYQ